MRKYDMCFYIICMLISITGLFACLPVEEKPLDDAFFVPVDTIKRQKPEPKPVPLYIGQTSDAENDVKKEIAVLIEKQSRQLDELNRKLAGIGNEKKADSAGRIEIEETPVVQEKKVSYEILLDMIRRQGSRIDDAEEWISLLSQNKKSAYAIKERSSAEKPIIKQRMISDDSLKEGPVAGYAEAVRLYKSREYARAIRVFQALLKEGIELRLQDNCYFWTGVSYFHLRRPNRAINELEKVLNIPGSDKNESACFMMGQCYEQMGTRKQAKSVFKKMLQDYPEGDLRQIAEIKIALLR